MVYSFLISCLMNIWCMRTLTRHVVAADFREICLLLCIVFFQFVDAFVYLKLKYLAFGFTTPHLY